MKKGSSTHLKRRCICLSLGFALSAPLSARAQAPAAPSVNVWTWSYFAAVFRSRGWGVPCSA